jgi:hypothetical protein
MLKTGRNIRFEAKDGRAAFDLQIDQHGLSHEQRMALDKLLESQDFNKLSKPEQEILQNSRVTATGAADAAICRFDLKCVSIKKEMSIDLLAMAERARGAGE